MTAAPVPAPRTPARPPTLAQTAQRLATWFWVFPLAAQSKIPLKDTAGCHGALRNRKLIAALWHAEPRANIGIATGKRLDDTRRLLVIDPDAPGGEHGDADGRIFVAAHPDLFPDTVRVDTPTGGQHRYYSYPAELHISNSDVNLPPGINVRGEGGYVVAPGSVHPIGGTYQYTAGCAPWEREIAPAPPGLLAMLCPPAADSPAPRFTASPASGERRPTPERLTHWGLDNTTRYGGRNNTAWRLGRQALANGYDGLEGETILLDYARQTGLPEREALRCWRSAQSYPRLAPWEQAAEGPPTEDPTPPPADLMAAGQSGVDATADSLDQSLLITLAALREENNQLRAELEQERAARHAAEAHARYVCQWQQVPNVLTGVKQTAPFVAFAYKQKVSACEADAGGWVSISLPAVAESQDASIPPYRERTPEQHKAVASRAEQVGRYVHDMAALGWIETRPGEPARTADGRPYRPLQIRPRVDAFLSAPLALPTPAKKTARPRKVAAVCPACHKGNTRQVVCYECLNADCRHIFTPEQADNAAELFMADELPVAPDPQFADQEAHPSLDPQFADQVETPPATPLAPPVDSFRISRDAVWAMAQQRAGRPPCPACGEPRPCLCDVAGRDGPAWVPRGAPVAVGAA